MIFADKLEVALTGAAALSGIGILGLAFGIAICVYWYCYLFGYFSLGWLTSLMLILPMNLC